MPGREQLHRLRVEYGKDGRLAYLGHLEVINTMGRCIRRSGLPFSVGNGFARRIRLQFSQALPVGASSRCEYYDLLLTDRVNEGEALVRLRGATPAGLAPVWCGYVPRELPAIEAWLTRSAWEVSFSRGVDRDALDGALRQLRDRGSLEYMRGEKRKVVDLGQTLVGWDWDEPGVLTLQTRATNQASLRPAVLLSATQGVLGREVPPYSVCRVGLWHEGVDGSLVEGLDTRSG
ncbi:MAG: TIGR03936 family radical SAM-associated protein [Olsenella sp.]|nr:TIGR03936 family radical SAM-associated protein [Olsenella sp.]